MENKFSEFYADIRQISNAIKANKLVVFVGAGVSMNSGIPSWDSLIGLLKKELTLADNENDYLKIAQLYKLSRKPKEYLERIRELLNYEKASYNPIHEVIFKLSPCHVVTTNYDNLLEQFAATHNLLYYPIIRDNDLPFATFENFIIKMHGDLSVGNIVLSEEEYLNYNINFPLTENYVKSLFSTKLILFIGFSFNDYNLKIITNKVKNILGTDFQPMYLMSLDSPDFLQLKYYEDRGVKIVSYNEEVNKNEKNDINNINELKDERGKKLYRFIDFVASFNVINHAIKDLSFIAKLLALNDYYLSELKFIGRKEISKLLPENLEQDSIGKSFSLSVTNTEIRQMRQILKGSIAAKQQFIKNNGYAYKKLLSIARDNLIFYLNFPDESNLLEGEYMNIRNPLKNKKDSLDYYYELNYDEVKRRITHLKNEKLGEVSIHNLELPFLLYKLGEDYEAYLVYKNIADKFWEQKKYTLFFLCMVNIKNLWGRLYNIKEQVPPEVLIEIDDIDLDKILSQLPINNPTIEKILRKITSYKFVLELTNKATELKDKILENKRINEGNGFAMNNDEIELYESIGWLWSFCNNNYIISEHFSENKKAYQKASEAFLIGYSVKPNHSNRFGRERYLPAPLNQFQVLLISIGVESKELIDILHKFKLGSITYDKQAKEYLNTALLNGVDTINKHKNFKKNQATYYQVYNHLENVLILLGRAELAANEIVNIYQLINKSHNIDFRPIADGLNSFIFKTQCFIDNISILENLIENIFKARLLPSYVLYSNMIKNLFHRILEINTGYKITSNIVLNELFSDCSLKDTYETEFVLILKDVLPEDKLEFLKQNILARLNINFEFELFNMAIAYHLDLGMAWERKFIPECIKYFKTRSYKSSSHDDWYLNTLYRFWIKHKTISNDKLVIELSKKQLLLSFLINPKDFDYSHEDFSINWFRYLKITELKKLLKIKKIKSYLRGNKEILQKEKWLMDILIEAL